MDHVSLDDIVFQGNLSRLAEHGRLRYVVSDDLRTIEGNPSHVYASNFIICVYETLTGYGDITASDSLGMVVSSVQMLAGMLYSVFIISHTQEIFFDRVRFIDVKRDEERRTEDVAENVGISLRRIITFERQDSSFENTWL